MCFYAMSCTGNEALSGEVRAQNVGVSTCRSVASDNVVVWGVGFSEVVCLPEVIMRPGMVAASTVSQEQEYY